MRALAILLMATSCTASTNESVPPAREPLAPEDLSAELTPEPLVNAKKESSILTGNVVLRELATGRALGAASLDDDPRGARFTIALTSHVGRYAVELTHEPIACATLESETALDQVGTIEIPEHQRQGELQAVLDGESYDRDWDRLEGRALLIRPLSEKRPSICGQVALDRGDPSKRPAS